MSTQTAQRLPETKSPQDLPPSDGAGALDLLRLALRTARDGRRDAFFDVAARRLLADAGADDCVIYSHEPDKACLALRAHRAREATTIPAPMTIGLDADHPLVHAWSRSDGEPAMETSPDGTWEYRVAIPSPLTRGGPFLGVVQLRSSLARSPMLDAEAVQRNVEDLAWALEHRALVDGHHREAETLRRSNRDLEALVYTAGHDLMEPMRSITEFSRFLLEDAGAQLGEEARDNARRIHEGGLRLQRMLGDLLRYSRAGRAAEPPTRVETKEVAAEVVETLHALIRERRASIDVRPLPAVMADRTSLFEILANLLSNALKFHGDGKPRVEIGGRLQGSSVELFVRDNGVGIPPQHQAKIFDLFFRVEPGRREGQAGSGVGLTIARRLVERHGGRIWVESKPGSGSTFRFTLPAADAVAPKSVARA